MKKIFKTLQLHMDNKIASWYFKEKEIYSDVKILPKKFNNTLYVPLFKNYGHCEKCFESNLDF